MSRPSTAPIRVKLKRCWINQPSAQQPYHKYHGMRVLAEDIDLRTVDVYPIQGPIHRFAVFKNCLSDGWPMHLHPSITKDTGV